MYISYPEKSQPWANLMLASWPDVSHDREWTSVTTIISMTSRTFILELHKNQIIKIDSNCCLNFWSGYKMVMSTIKILHSWFCVVQEHTPRQRDKKGEEKNQATITAILVFLSQCHTIKIRYLKKSKDLMKIWCCWTCNNW